MPMRETQPQHLVSICKIKNISGHLGNSLPLFSRFRTTLYSPAPADEAINDGNAVPSWAIHPPSFRRCSFGARPVRSGRAAEKMRGKVEASIDQPPRERQANKAMAGTVTRKMSGLNQASHRLHSQNFPVPPPMPMRGRRGINRS